MPPWTDKITAICAVVSILISIISAALIIFNIGQAANALEIQNQSRDIQSVLALWDKLDQHWNRFRSAEEDRKQFEFGQLIGYYEMSCSLFKEGVFTTVACKTLEEHLAEILPAMRSHPIFNKYFDELKSRDETFENIRWFCDKKGININ